MLKHTVLVVEDDALLRCAAVVMLAETGADVVDVGSADDALSYLVEHADSVSAVFTDVQTPGSLDGLQLARSITSAWPEIKVLVTSGRVSPTGDLPEQVQFMCKPWVPQDVITAIAA